MLRVQIEMVRAQNPRKISPKELLASDFEALEAFVAPRSDQESVKEVSKSSKVTIHPPSRVIMSPPGAAVSPPEAPTALLESQNQVQSSSQKCPKLLLLSSVVEIYATFRILIIAGIRKTVYKAVVKICPLFIFVYPSLQLSLC